MPSVDHCLSQATEMTTLTNSLEVFDTYKHRDDKDSDEESFHLPLDDDESESKYQDAVVKNGNETEDEILNKFDSSVTPLEPIDSRLEERLLNDEEEEEQPCIKENGTDEITEDNSTKLDVSEIENETVSPVNKISEDTQDKKNTTSLENTCEKDTSFNDLSEDTTNTEKSSALQLTASEPDKSSEIGNDDVQNDEVMNESCTTEGNNEVSEGDKIVDEVEKNENCDVPKVDLDTEEVDSTEKHAALCSLNENEEIEESTDKMDDSPLPDVNNVENEGTNESKAHESRLDGDVTEKDNLDDKSNKCMIDKPADKCENSNDSSKNQNEDSEDLFDISIIRDAEEDNAESAYNEAHPEESHLDENEDYDDRNDDKVEDDFVCDRSNHLEEDEEEDDIDVDKHEDQLKGDDVDIEETNLKLDCDVLKEGVSDGESDSGNKTDSVDSNKEQVENSSENSNSVTQSIAECRLDEITGDLVGGDNMETNSLSEVTSDGTVENSMDIGVEDAEKRKSLKRTLSHGVESGAAKKSRTEQVEVETEEIEKPKEKLPLRTLLSLSEFMKSKKPNKRLTMQDLEQFCLQKICEVIVHKSDLGDVHHQLKLQEQLIETMRKEIQQLTKQARDLEIVNKKLMNDLKQQTATQKPLNPLKITRSVGLQVKFTPVFEANMKRRQPNPTLTTQKVHVQTTATKGPRNVPNTPSPSVHRQTVPQQKQQQHQQQPQQQQQQQQPQQQQPQVSKPNTPLLSQALQNRRVAANETVNKTPPQTNRSKPSEVKNGPSASVIDLTDEDDKRDKNKNMSPKMITQKNIAVPLRTTPMRVNATPGIRLATSQGKVSPITSVVPSSTPQVMYVVQSTTSQNILGSPLGPKAVVVNFQSPNGVIPSTINGSAVSVIPKQSNTIQLKTVTPSKQLSNNKMMKISTKHPAPLPPPPVVRVNLDKPLKPIPPKPHLTIRKTDTGIILQWKMPYELEMYEVIASYQLYAYQETSAMPSTDMWRKVGDVKALALPMACTLTQFADKNKYYFAVRPVDIHKRIGVFSDPEEISL